MIRIISVTFVVLLTLSACGVTPTEQPYQNEYIIMEIIDDGYSIDGNTVATDQLGSLPEILKAYPVKKVLLQSENGPSMGELFSIAPVLSSAGYRLFFLNKDDEPQEMVWVAP